VYIIISTAVTAVFGLLFRDAIEAFFYRPFAVSLFLFLTGVLLLITRFAQDRGKQISEMGFHVPLIIGCAQAFSMLPGISRSGTTISTGLYMGMERSLSGSYSFLLSIPSILGASLVEFIRAHGAMQSISGGRDPLLLIFLGFFLSLVAGYGALRLLLSFLGRGRLYTFSYYCFAAAIASAFVLLAYS
jgi:undecaprenyl-diphosphatase